MNKQTFEYSKKVSEELYYIKRSDAARLNSNENRFRLDISDLHKFVTSFDGIQRKLTYDHPAMMPFEIVANLPTKERITYYQDLSKIIEAHINNYIVLSDNSLFETWNNFNAFLNSYIDSASNPLPRNTFHRGGNNPVPTRDDPGTPLSNPEAARFVIQRDNILYQTTKKLEVLKKPNVFSKPYHF